MKLRRLAVAMMRQADWPRWLELDPDFQPDFDHWRRRMEDAVKRLKAQGVNVVKVTLDPDQFVAWLASDAGAQYRALAATHQRAGYAAMRAMKMDLH